MAWDLPKRTKHVERGEILSTPDRVEAVLHVRQRVVLLHNGLVRHSKVERHAPTAVWLAHHDDRRAEGGGRRR
eukprot:7985641-Prorocentrum_lima.AAC.1